MNQVREFCNIPNRNATFIEAVFHNETFIYIIENSIDRLKSNKKNLDALFIIKICLFRQNYFKTINDRT